jgi:uncharacterized phage protein (TIGR01671 family)
MENTFRVWIHDIRKPKMQYDFELAIAKQRNYPIMLNTRLLDKNQKPIFEGDILRQWLEDNNEPEGGFWWEAEVKMINGCFHLCQLGFDYKDETPTFLYTDAHLSEIIGNIYERP